jgi:uncharacterized membrane protein (DUF106 family)
MDELNKEQNSDSELKKASDTNSENDLNKEQEKSKPFEETTSTENKEILEEAKKEVKVENSEEVQDNKEENNTEVKQENKLEETPKEEPKDTLKGIPKGHDASEKKIEIPIITPKNKEGSFKPIVFVMIASMAIALFWDKIPFIKDSVHAILDPSAGFLLNWNATFGMIIIIGIISLFTTLVQKYATDQKALKELRKEQKILQEEMKKYKEHPEKMAELSKKQFAFLPKTFKLTSRAMMFTGIPFILFFRWFNDFFSAFEVEPVFLGFLSWFWFYLIFTMVFSTILRKVFKVV